MKEKSGNLVQKDNSIWTAAFDPGYYPNTTSPTGEKGHLIVFDPEIYTFQKILWYPLKEGIDKSYLIILIETMWDKYKQLPQKRNRTVTLLEIERLHDDINRIYSETASQG